MNKAQISQNLNIEQEKNQVLAHISKRKRIFTTSFYGSCLILGIIFGLLNIQAINQVMDLIATIFTRLFSFIAVPIIALALISTLAKLSNDSSSGRIFKQTIFYTLTTTLIAASIGAILYWLVKPQNVPQEIAGSAQLTNVPNTTYVDHIINAIPNNILQPFVSGNVLSVLLISAAIGIALALMPRNEKRQAVLNVILGFQDILFMLIKWIIAILPIGIMGFTAKLVLELEHGVALGSLATYFAIVIGANLIQAFIVLPGILMARGLNPLKVARGMLPAITLALFSKSSAGTLPVTMASAENNCHVNPKVSRFVLPICTTINMNGCAGFILITSLFLMQNAGIEINMTTTIMWVLIATVAAIGNAGVPMGCYFMTISLLSSMQVPVLLMGIILPVYAIIDMIETGVNVWSDASVANIVNQDLKHELNSANDEQIINNSHIKAS